MTRIWLALVPAVALCACTVGDGPIVDPPNPSPPPTAGEQPGISAQFQGDPGPDICDLLPPDGPCALACDPQQLAAKYVPEGACAAFACTLTDGRMITVSACHYPEST